jgi:hypothetical protein
MKKDKEELKKGKLKKEEIILMLLPLMVMTKRKVF